MRVAAVRTFAVVAVLVAAGCGPSAGTSPDPPQSSPTTTGSSTGSTWTVNYLTLMVFSATVDKAAAIDPMTFVSKPGTPAGVGPLSIRHVAGVTPAMKASPPTAPLMGADGKALGITLGPWEQATGTVVFTCKGSELQAASKLKGLIPSATYSTFVVHTSKDGPKRFTPWGDPAGTTNNFTASATGTASPTNTVHGCSSADVIIIIWHSDARTHGKSPGQIGVDWHTTLIARVF